MKYNITVMIVFFFNLWVATAMDWDTYPEITEQTKKLRHINADRISKPKIEGAPDFSIRYTQNFLGSDTSRLFFIELNIKSSHPRLELEFDEKFIVFVDRQPEPFQIDSRRYYFRTVEKASGETFITFSSNGTRLSLPIEVWNSADLNRPRYVKGMAFPRRFPLHRSFSIQKESRLHPRPKFQNIEPKLLCSGQKGRPGYREVDINTISDDRIWRRLIPDSSIGRYQSNPLDTCPHDGKAVFKVHSFYPWVIHSSLLDEGINIYSPISGKKIFTNDFSKGDMFSGPRADDGFNGYKREGELVPLRGHMYYHQANMAQRFPKLAAENYFRTGEISYLRKALVSISRIAMEYAYLAAMPQHRKTHFDQHPQRMVDCVPMEGLGNCGFLNHGIGTCGHIKNLSTVYDNLFDEIEKDKGIVAFLQERGLPIASHRDLKRYIEENLFLTSVQALLDGKMHTNYPGSPYTWLHLSSILKYRTKVFMDIAYEGNGYFQGGIIRNMLTNGFFRDGIKKESMSGYNYRATEGPLALMEALNLNLNAHPELYPEDLYTRVDKDKQLVTALKSAMKSMTLDNAKMQFGDGGGLPVFGGDKKRGPYKKKYFTGDEVTTTFIKVNNIFQDKDLAWAIAHSDYRPPKGHSKSQDDYKALVNGYRPDWLGNKSDLLSGYGVAVLRDGQDVQRRAMYTRYGKSVLGHNHDNTMSLCLDAFSSPIFRSWGYPMRWNNFYRNWVTNNTGRHFPLAPSGHPAEKYATEKYDRHCYLSGQPELLIDSGDFKVSQTSATLLHDRYNLVDDPQHHIPHHISRYETLPMQHKRTNVMVHVNDEEFYCLDIYHMEGGDEHWRSFSPIEGDLQWTGIKTKPQSTGTLAGPKVELGSPEWIEQHGQRRMGFSYLENVERGRADDVWSATWDLKGSQGLRLRMQVLEDDGAEVAFCTAKDPSNSYPDLERQFVMLNHRGIQGAFNTHSQVVSLFDLYREEPVIQSVTALKMSEDPSGKRSTALMIESSERTDILVISDNCESTKIVEIPRKGLFIFKGKMAMASIDKKGSVVALHLIEGEYAQLGEQRVEGKANLRAKIHGVDYENWEISLGYRVPHPEGLVGRNAFIRRMGLKIGYEILEAKQTEAGTVLTLNCSPLRFTGVVRDLRSHKVYVGKSTEGSYGFGSAFESQNREFHGARILNQSTQKELILDAGLGKLGMFKVQPTQKATQEELKVDFPLGSIFRVYDYGVGDDVIIPFDHHLSIQ